MKNSFNIPTSLFSLERLGFRLWIIGLAIMISFIFLTLIFRPYVLEPLGFLNTSKTGLHLRYQTYENSALIHVIPTGYWIWFDGKDILLYGIPRGDVCDTGFESAIVYDTQKQTNIGYLCAKSIEKVQDFYTEKKSPYEYIYINNPPADFDMYAVINYLNKKQIITI